MEEQFIPPIKSYLDSASQANLSNALKFERILFASFELRICDIWHNALIGNYMFTNLCLISSRHFVPVIAAQDKSMRRDS